MAEFANVGLIVNYYKRQPGSIRERNYPMVAAKQYSSFAPKEEAQILNIANGLDNMIFVKG